MATYLFFLCIHVNNTSWSHFGLNILLNFYPWQRGEKGLLALKPKTVKFDRHYERGLYSYITCRIGIAGRHVVSTPRSNVLRMCERAGQIGGPTLIHNTKIK